MEKLPFTSRPFRHRSPSLGTVSLILIDDLTGLSTHSVAPSLSFEDTRRIARRVVMAEEAVLIFPSISAFFVQKSSETFIESGRLMFECLVQIFIFHPTHLLLVLFHLEFIPLAQSISIVLCRICSESSLFFSVVDKNIPAAVTMTHSMLVCKRM